MNLRQVETFYWAARLGGFARAAHHLHATPSAVSMRIRELEASLQMTLFARGAGAASLTVEGRRLLPLAERLVQAAGDIADLAGGQGHPAGLVRLGVAEAVATTWLPDFLAGLRQECPDVTVDVSVGLSHYLEQQLQQGAIDALMAPTHLTGEGYLSTSLGAIEFRWMYCPAHFDLPPVLPAAGLARLPLIATSRDAGYRGATAEWLQRNQVQLNHPTICNTFSVAARLCAAGQGLALLPVEVYARDLETGTLQVLICDPQPEPLEHFLVHAAGRDRATMAALARVALGATTFTRAGRGAELAQQIS